MRKTSISRWVERRKDMFVIYHYPYGRKHKKMYLMAFECKKPKETISSWTFKKEQAIRFEKDTEAHLVKCLVLEREERRNGGIESYDIYSE